MFDRASKKLGLEQAVLGTFNNENDDDKPTSKEMEQLLKKGAYALLDDEDEETNQFCADDIDSILAKRTRTRVVEGTKTASWLNKAGMVVSKSKFSAEGGSAGVNVDDPDFWQKVMPDFVTPQLMLEKLNELSDLMGGGTTIKKKTGRGRGRWKKKVEEINDDSHENDPSSMHDDTEGKDVEDVKEGEIGDVEIDDEDTRVEEEKTGISKTIQRKVAKYMADLKSMMTGILEDAEDDSLQASDKQACQKLLLTISMKERLFSDEQRHLARSLLKKLEGDRRRRCRTSVDGFSSRDPSSRAFHGSNEKDYGIPEDLLILSKQQRRKRRKDAGMKRRPKKGEDDDDGEAEVEADVDEDGFLRHSDDEGDWSDVGDDVYGSGIIRKRATISVKEARRRRGWAQDDDEATAAGRPWPAFPRHLVNDVLGSILEEIMEYDESISGGMFSKPVPRDEYPEYYELIKKPMDYGTMKEKLERGEYRSAQGMQKDFVLVMQNCIKFNDPNSEVVKKARQQALLRPTALRNAAKKFSLFLAEDGSVLEIIDDEKKKDSEVESSDKISRKSKKRSETEEEIPRKAIKRGRRKKKDEIENDDDDDDKTVSENEDDIVPEVKKPRIKISLNFDNTKKKPMGKKRKREEVDDVVEVTEVEIEKTPSQRIKRGGKKKNDVESQEIPRKKRNKVDKSELAEINKADAKGEPTSKRVAIAEEVKKRVPSIFMDVAYWQCQREKLNDSFEDASALYAKHGPWSLPREIGENRFYDVATTVLSKMCKHDRYSVFLEAVDEKSAPDYYEVIENPMDFGQMIQKIEEGVYGTGSSAAAALYEDFKLVFENCKMYNDDDGDVIKEGARLFGLLPETYADACCTVLGKRKKIKERISKG
jgi:Bromodomain